MGGVFFSCCGLFYLNLFGRGIFFSLVVVILEEKKYIRCHLSCVMCHTAIVAYNLSPVTNPNSYSHRPSPC